MIMPVVDSGLRVYQIKVTLEDSQPPIWRRFQVPGDARMSKLHRVLQVVMGWTNSHLHQFVIDGKYCGVPDPEFEKPIIDEKKVLLSQLVNQEADKFIYEYDFGDNWTHELLVEKIGPPEPVSRYPICLTGERACPPEDCGGLFGYYANLKIIKDPQHPQHDEIVRWMGGGFDPEKFDLEAVNRALRKIR